MVNALGCSPSIHGFNSHPLLFNEQDEEKKVRRFAFVNGD